MFDEGIYTLPFLHDVRLIEALFKVLEAVLVSHGFTYESLVHFS